MDSLNKTFVTIMGGVVLVFIVLMGAVSFVDYQFQERNAELFIECMDIAETNEQVIACNSRFGD